MAKEITLSDLINQVRNELLSNMKDVSHPLFLVEKVEIELQIGVTIEGSGGIKVTVLPIEAGASISRERSHTIKLTLSPILTQEEQRELLQQQTEVWEGVKKASVRALRKSIKLSGEPE
jgi:hypothetical protein